MNIAYMYTLLFACTVSTPAPPQLPNSDAEILLAADLNGDGADEVIAIEGERVLWNQEEYSLSGSVQTYRVGPSGQGNKEIVLLATGRSRSSPRAKPSIIRINESSATPLYIGERISERISDLRIAPSGTFVTRIQKGKTAEGAWLKDGVFDTQTKSIMGLQQIPLADGRFAIGRLYGDKAKDPGGLEIHADGKEPIQLPVMRGVRTLELADLNNDGHQDLLVADGWHYRYGDEGRARLLTFLGPDYLDRRIIAEIDTAYTINRIEVVASQSKHPPSILIHASHGTFMLNPTSISWEVEAISVPQPDKTIVPVTNGAHRWLLGPEGQANRLSKP